MHRLWQILESFPFTWSMLLVGLVIGIAVSVLAYWAVVFMVVRIPADYFCPERRRMLVQEHPVRRWTIVILKNLLGFLIALVGMVLTLPGVPGPGLVLIVMGLFLVDFPGKRRLELRLLTYPRVLRAINARRERAGVPPLIIPPADNPASD